MADPIVSDWLLSHFGDSGCIQLCGCFWREFESLAAKFFINLISLIQLKFFSENLVRN